VVPALVGAIVQHLPVGGRGDCAIGADIGQHDQLPASPVDARARGFQRAEALAERHLGIVADRLARQHQHLVAGKGCGQGCEVAFAQASRDIQPGDADRERVGERRDLHVGLLLLAQPAAPSRQAGRPDGAARAHRRSAARASTLRPPGRAP